MKKDIQIEDSKTVQKRKKYQEIYEKHLKHINPRCLSKKAKELKMNVNTLRRIKEQGDTGEGFFSKKGPGKPKSFDTEDIKSIELELIFASLKDFKIVMRNIQSLKKNINESELGAHLVSKRLLCDIKNELYSFLETDKQKLKKKMKNPLFSIHPLNIISKQQTQHSIAGSSCDNSHSEESSSPLLSTYSTEQSTSHQDSIQSTLSNPLEEESQEQNVLSEQFMGYERNHGQQEHFEKMNPLEEEQSQLNVDVYRSQGYDSLQFDSIFQNYLQTQENLSLNLCNPESKIFVDFYDDPLSLENSYQQQEELVHSSSPFYQESLKTPSLTEEQYQPPFPEEDSFNANPPNQVNDQYEEIQTEENSDVDQYFN